MSETWIGQALEQLRINIASANLIGNVEGMLARHILGTHSRLHLQWAVDCDRDWLRSTYDPSNVGSVAALAYTVEYCGNVPWRADLETGLRRAIDRDPKAAGPGAALHDPAVLIGLCLGSRTLADKSPQFKTWCSSVVQDLLARPTRRVDAMLAYAAELTGSEPVRLSINSNAPLANRAGLDWWLRRPGNRSVANIAELAELRRSVVDTLLSEPMPQLPGHEAALLWHCVREAVTDTTSSALHTPANIAHFLRQFESSLKRWRWDGSNLQRPVRWPIRSEREVQDILWLMLRPIAADLEDEDTLPKFGHSTYRADLGIPSLGLLIEVKFARSASDFKEIEKQVLEDLVPYLKTPERYREVLVFIYDDSSSVQHHDTTIKALRTVAGINDVIVACRPSQLPPGPDQIL